MNSSFIKSTDSIQLLWQNNFDNTILHISCIVPINANLLMNEYEFIHRINLHTDNEIKLHLIFCFQL